jgi:hypothetical protein
LVVCVGLTAILVLNNHINGIPFIFPVVGGDHFIDLHATLPVLLKPGNLISFYV